MGLVGCIGSGIDKYHWSQAQEHGSKPRSRLVVQVERGWEENGVG